MTFGLASVAVAAVIGVATWRLASQYMIDQRIQRATLEATVTAQTLSSTVDRAASLRESLEMVTTDPDTTIIVGGDDGPWLVAGGAVDPDSVPAELRTVTGQPRWQTLTIDGATILAMAVPSSVAGVPVFVELFELIEYDRVRQFLMLVLIGGVVASGVFGVAIGWWASSRALRPLTELTRAAGRVAAGDLTARLPDRGDPDLGALAATFNASVADLQERVRRDARFAGDVSHELRSPLTTMVNAVEVLHRRRDSFDPQGRQAVDLMQAEVDRFRVMVVDLLEISRADQDTGEQNTELVDMGELVRRVAASIPGSPEPEVETPPPVVRGDRRRLVRVIANLLDNARRHGGGAIRVAVSRRHTPPSGPVARIEVDDGGPGIPPEHRQQVFERFTRIRGADHADDGGTGLGLALVARHVARHHGTVRVEDRPGGGARFVVELPCLP